MEPLNRAFRARLFNVAAPIALVVAAEVLALGLIPLEHIAVGIVGLVMIVCTVLVGGMTLMSKLCLHANNTEFVASILIFNWILFRRSAEGVSWHAVASESRSLEAGPNDFTPYRVEVMDEFGVRRIVMGPFLGWIYGVDCL